MNVSGNDQQGDFFVRKGTSMSVGTRKTRVASLADQQLQQQAQQLLTQEIRFIFVSEFESLTGNDGAIRAAEELLDRLQHSVENSEHEVAIPADMDLDETVAFRNWSSPDPLLSFDDEQVLFRAMNLLRFRVNQKRARLSANKPSGRLVAEMLSMLSLVERIRTQLVNSNLRLVSSIARKFSASGCDVDDFSSDGCMILLGAIDRFDYSRGFRFSTYATHSIQRHFYRAWKVRQRRRERFPNAASEILTEVPQAVSEEPVCSDPEFVVADLLARADSLLDDREQRILMSRYGLGADREVRTLREIASDLGISKERVRQLQMKALAKLKELLVPEGSAQAMAMC